MISGVKLQMAADSTVLVNRGMIWFLIALAVVLLIFSILLLFQLLRLERRMSERDEQQLLLRHSVDQLEQSLMNRVNETNRELREINALFLTQIQQTGQGSNQMLDKIRQSIQEQMERISVHLHEMQEISSDVRSLRQALVSVRGRGIIGELQLERLLSDILSPTQYRTQVRIRPGRQEAVDAAVLLSGESGGSDMLLPIDAKFPLDYLHRLLAAREADDEEAASVFSRELTGRLRQEAKKISELYIIPPQTTDFAILYLPSETLFAEAMRDGSLASDLYRQYRVLLAGPTSMASILAGLQAIFRLWTMERRTFLIAQILSGLQHDFQRYETSLERIHNRLARSVSETEECLRQAIKIRQKLESLDLTEWLENNSKMNLDGMAGPSDEI